MTLRRAAPRVSLAARASDADTAPRRHPQGVRRLHGAARTSTSRSRRASSSASSGPSGCGKTTLLRIIAGLETQTAGRILQAGRDISRLPPAERDYGIVFQSYALFPNLTVADNVAYGLVNRKVAEGAQPRRASTELLKLVGLPGSGSKFPAQLSGGQQQRIALARALATSPGLLLLDEPLSALDALERVRLRQEIRSLQQQARRDDDHGDARPGRGALGRRPHRRHEPRRDRADRHADGDLPRPGDAVRRRLRRQDQRALRAAAPRAGPAHRRQPLRLRARHRAERDVKVYLRPEDVLARPIAPGDANVFDGAIDKIEFLGSYCLVRVSAEAIGTQPITVYLSLNFLAEQALAVGSRLPLKLLPERMRFF